MSLVSSPETSNSVKEETAEDIMSISQEMNQRAKDNIPFSDFELDRVIGSICNLMIPSSSFKDSEDQLRQFLQQSAHLSHKDWIRTGQNAELLQSIFLSSKNEKEDHGIPHQFREMFHRVFDEGNWDGAYNHSQQQQQKDKPWVVLVTGVNGIRKTTSVYQHWFPNVLREAMVLPKLEEMSEEDLKSLPTGQNTFFRQLDHMIATIVNEEFQRLYQLTSKLQSSSSSSSEEVIDQYSNLKASIFARYRTLSEMIGIILVHQAQKHKCNIMIETSGRDVAMFHYVDSLFPEGYRKLALHFTIDDVTNAEASVDGRMVQEMKDGIQAMMTMMEGGNNIRDVIRANAGGPYGSHVLRGVQAESDRVWEEVVMKDGGVGDDWFKASIQINSSKDASKWTANAIRPDGATGEVFKFERL